MLFDILYLLHILLMIAAVGTNITYAIWIQRATINGDALPFTLRGIKMLDDRVALPAYGLLLVTGLGMVLADDLAFDTPWILTSLILWLALILLGLFGYTPTLRKQIKLAETVGPDSEEYKAVAWRGTALGIAAGVIVLVIISLMVFKPALWA
jgi:uncharacterized membrane protein